MISIGVENISLSFGGETVLDEINFSLNEGDKLGIVGVNGAGKSSLLRIITGEYIPDGGNIYVAKNHNIAVLDQHLALNPENDVYSELLSVFSLLIETERALEDIQKKLNPVILTPPCSIPGFMSSSGIPEASCIAVSAAECFSVSVLTRRCSAAEPPSSREDRKQGLHL